MSHKKSNSRRELILTWLQTSKYSQPLNDKIFNDNNKENGFRVHGGRIVRLKSGERIDLLEWLKREGFDDIDEVGNFTVSYDQPACEFINESLTFFNKSRLPKEISYDNSAINKEIEFVESCRPDPYFSEESSIVDNWLQSQHCESDGYDDYGDYDDYNEYVRGHLD